MTTITEIRVDDEILLRWPTMADVEEIYAIIDSNRVHLERWLPWVENVRSSEAVCGWIEDCVRAQSDGTGTPPLLVYQGAIAGLVETESFDLRRKSCEIGYYLSEHLQGRGIVSRACRRILACVFDSMGMNRVQIRVMPQNTRSMAIPQRLGFVYEGVQRQAQLLHGQFHDFAVFSLLASEWACQSHAVEGTAQTTQQPSQT